MEFDKSNMPDVLKYLCRSCGKSFYKAFGYERCPCGSSDIISYIDFYGKDYSNEIAFYGYYNREVKEIKEFAKKELDKQEGK